MGAATSSRLRKFINEDIEDCTEGINIDGPVVPLFQRIFNGFPVDAEMLLSGQLLSTNGFFVIFSCPNNNVPLLLRVESGSVVIRSCVEGRWSDSRQLHFFESEIEPKDDQFMLRILHQIDCFMIYVRSSASELWEICSIEHHVDPAQIDTISMDGNVLLNSVYFIGFNGHIMQNAIDRNGLTKRRHTVI